MTRAGHIEYEGALYHVLSLGNQRCGTVADDRDRDLFLQSMGETPERFEPDILAAAWMDNRNHLLFRTHRVNLSKSVQRSGAICTKRFNIRHLRSGHFFEGRFRSMFIKSDAYLRQLSYYIRRNPL